MLYKKCFGYNTLFVVLFSATLVLWKNNALVVADGVLLSKDSSSVDYVSLTDNSRGGGDSSSPMDYGNSNNNGSNQSTWTLDLSCNKLEPGCKCDHSTSKGLHLRSVTCTCSDNQQVVNLKGGERKEHVPANEAWSWRISGCYRVIIHQNFLSSFFDSGSKLKLDLQFQNITHLIIHEAAFTLKDSGSLAHETKVLFNKCDIENVPPKAFPSFLTSVEFNNCQIGRLSQRFIQSLKMNQISFENSTINSMESDAFYSNSFIKSLVLKHSHILNIRPHSVASGIQNLNLTDSIIDHVETDGLVGLIANFVLKGCKIGKIESYGLSVKSWSTMAIDNNVFENVSYRGIDLTWMEPKQQSLNRPAQLIGNVWHHVDQDFIVSGASSEQPFVTVENNTFNRMCSCGTTFTRLISLNGSREWFQDEMLQVSRCPIDEKERACFNFENSTASNDGFVSYNELPLLCSTEMFMCMSEVKDMQVNPQLPNRLQMVAFLIGAFVLFMIVSLLLTCLVYMIRRQNPRKQDGENANSELANDLPRKEFVKSLNNDPYGVINQKIPKTPSMPSRMGGLLEDVEMEDKGVQTLPTELSADIIEGLREKLSKPDSFWDAKETIDHLYDLIHVRDQCVSTSSPPDVTVRIDSETPSNSSSKSQNLSSDSLKLLVSPSKRPKVLPLDKSQRRSMSTFTQLPSSSKASTPVCDYTDPSDSQSHIYSELSGLNSRRACNAQFPPKPTILCEYTDPKDFQTHIYAELFNVTDNQNTMGSNVMSNFSPVATSTNGSPFKTSYAQTNKNFEDIPSSVNSNESGTGDSSETTLTSSVIMSSTPQKNHSCSNISSTLNDLNSEPNNTKKSYGTSKHVTPFSGGKPYSGSSTTTSNSSSGNNFSDANIPNNTHTNLKRPLPSIPVPSVSSSTVQ